MGKKGASGRRAGRRWDGIRKQRLFLAELLESRVLLEAVLNQSGATYLPPEHTLDQVGAFLSGPSSAPPLQVATNFIASHVAQLGLTGSDLNNLAVTNQYTDSDTGTTHIYMRQTLDALPIFNANLSINITRDGRVINLNSTFVSLANAGGAGVVPVMSAVGALQSFAGNLNLSLTSPPSIVSTASSVDQYTVLQSAETSTDPIPARLEFVATQTDLKLAWDLIVRTVGGAHWYDVGVDSTTGILVAANDWVDYADYNVIAQPNRSPDDGPRVIVTDPADPTASPFGWHDTNGVAGAEFTDTEGNNVFAQQDTAGTHTGLGPRPDGGPSLDFNFPLDLTQAPSGYQDAAVTNLFYWANLAHDIHYKYGFTEAAGNFQVNNYGNGGIGNDAVQADAQDGEGLDNAYMATPPDGQSPNLVMFLWDLTTPGRDGDLDSEVMVHEYGHGVSNRLTGGPANANALDALQSGGMGEGWSDWWAAMFTQTPSGVQNQGYPTGNYIFGLPPSGGGIRRFPYSYNMSIDPLTFDAYGFTGFGGGTARSLEVHDTGEIWCSALWDMNWLLIDKYGYSPNLASGYSPGAAGNILALKLVMDALKLQPANPSFTDARDAILQADTVLNGGADLLEIWTAFARRGLGLSAVDTSADALSVTTAFDVPLIGAVVGHVWDDANDDGIHDQTELPMAGVTVDLFHAGDNPLIATPAATITTDLLGIYEFSRPADGNYFVYVHPKSGFVYTLEHQGTDSTLDSDIDPVTGESAVIAINANTPQTVVDSGLTPNGIVIGNEVFNDANGDGIQQIGEVGVNGVAVTLFSVGVDGLAHTGDDVQVATTTTLGGTYEFDQVDPGTYYIHVDRPTGYVASPQDVGSDDSKDSDVNPATGDSAPFSVVAHQKLLTEDAGMFIPTVTISNISVPEGNTGTSLAIFTLTLSAASDVPVSVDYSTADGSAVAGVDYVDPTIGSGTNTVTFNPGDTTATISIDIIGNTTPEPDKLFFLNLALPAQPFVVIAKDSATCTILNDDLAGVRVNNASPITESPTGTSAVFTVSLVNNVLANLPNRLPITVHYTTMDGTAAAGTHYTSESGTITFMPGETAKTVVIPVPPPRNFDQSNLTRTFFLQLTDPTNANLSNNLGEADITPIVKRSVDFGGAVAAHYTDNSGNRVTVTLTGPGIGHVMFLGTNASDGIGIDVSGTDATSQLSILTNHGQTSFVSILAENEIGAILGKTSNLTGNLTTTGGVKQLALNFVASGNQFTIGASNGTISNLTAQFGRVIDLSIASALPIRSLKMSSDNDSDGVANVISAPSISTLSSLGDFDSDVLLSGSLGNMTVGGTLRGSHIRAGENIGSVTANKITGSTIFAGVKNNITGVPTSTANFSNTSSSIRSVTVRSKAAGAFSSSIISAPNITALNLSNINTHNSGILFGVASEAIGSIRGSTGNHPFAFNNLAGTGTGFSQDDFILSLL